MTIKVFIECEPGRDEKNVFDEKTLERKETFKVSRKYPFAYGFIQDTVSGDGDCLDSFILTDKPLKVGEIVEVEVVGAMEQFETRDGVTKEDHNILACISGENYEITPTIQNSLKEFISHVWDHRVGKKVDVGNFLNKERAEALIKSLNKA